MHGGMQPLEKDGPDLPPLGVHPNQGATAPWVGPPGHRLRVVGLAPGLDLSHGYNQGQFCVVRAFLYFLVCVFLNTYFGTLHFLRGMAHFHLFQVELVSNIITMVQVELVSNIMDVCI